MKKLIKFAHPQCNFEHFGVVPTTTVGDLILSDADCDTLFVKPRRKTRKTRKTRGFRKALQRDDNLIGGVSTHPPGSKQRVADLAAFYDIAERFDVPPSAFDC